MYLLIVPAVVVVVSILLRLAAGPYWAHNTIDPSYTYLLNGLYIATGTVPGYIDHPGTPLQLLICLIIELMNIGQPQIQMINHVINDPELYLHVTCGVLLLVYFITAVSLSFYILKKTSDTLAGVLVQLPALSLLTLNNYTNISAELLLLGTTNIFMMGLLKIYFAQTSKEKTISTLWSGLAAGLGTAVKFTFLPLLIVPMLLLGWGRVFLLLSCFAISFIIGTFPILARYPDLWSWAYGLASHSGIHGNGAAGFIDTRSFMPNIMITIRNEWFYALIIVLGLVLSLWPKAAKDARISWFMLALVLGMGLEWSIVGKYQKDHYLYCDIELGGLLLMTMHLFLKERLSVFYPRACLCFIVLFALLTTAEALKAVAPMRRSTVRTLDFYKDLREQYPNALIIGCYGATLKDAALSMGASFGRSEKIMDALARMYPASIFRNCWSHRFMSFKGAVFSNDFLAQGQKVILIETGKDCINGPFLLRKIGEIEGQKVYEMVATVEKEALIYYLLAAKAYSQGDYKTALEDAEKSRSLHYLPSENLDNFIRLLQKQAQSSLPT